MYRPRTFFSDSSPPPMSDPLFTASPSSVPSLCHSSPSSSSSSLLDVPFPLDRPNQHLAVLLPKYLWKVRLSLSLSFFLFDLYSFICNSPTPLPLPVTIFIVACSSPSLSAATYVYFLLFSAPISHYFKIVLALSQMWRRLLRRLLFAFHTFT